MPSAALTGLKSEVRIGPVGVAMVCSLSVMSTRQGDSRVGRVEPEGGFTRSSSCGNRLLAPGSDRLELEEEEVDLSIAFCVNCGESRLDRRPYPDVIYCCMRMLLQVLNPRGGSIRTRPP